MTGKPKSHQRERGLAYVFSGVTKSDIVNLIKREFWTRVTWVMPKRKRIDSDDLNVVDTGNNEIVEEMGDIRVATKSR